MTRPVCLALVGLGNIGRAFLDLMDVKADLLRDRFGLELLLTGVADSHGGLIDPQGIDHTALLAHKGAGRSVAEYPGASSRLSATEMVAQAPADFLLDAATVNLRTGQPGLDCTRIALRRGMGAVLADKGPMVLAFGELTAASINTPGLAYSATVCGALPVVNIGQRDLAACRYSFLRGVFNSTTNHILTSMTRGGSYSQALRQAQLDGVAETDSTLDVDGWDAANKLVIVANSLLRQPSTLANVTPVTGITGITTEAIQEQMAKGYTVKLVASAYWDQDHYKLSVQPEWLPANDFLANINGWEIGIVLETDIMGTQQFKVDERGPIPTAAAMLRDLINLAQ